MAAEQKARATYDNILRLVDDPDVRDPIKFLRQREINHFQRFGDAIHTLSNRFVENQTMGIYLAKPVADILAVTFTAILFVFQFKKAIKKIDIEH